MEEKIEIGTRGLYYNKEPYSPPCILKSIEIDCPDEISIPTEDDMRLIYKLENPDGVIYEAAVEDISTSREEYLTARLIIIEKELLSILKYIRRTKIQ